MQSEATDTSSNLGGRPTKYKAAFNKQAKMLCLLGATDKIIAEFFDINVDTLHEWKKSYPRFSDSLQGGKIIADAAVAQSLYKRAVGYKYTEVTFEKIADKITLEITPDSVITQDAYKKKIVVKQLPGDVGAQTLWLKNRQKELWRDNKAFDFDFENLSDEQLDKIIRELIAHNKKYNK